MFTVDRRVWHFTRGENLHSIFAAGRLDCDRNATPAVSVGNPRIKAARAERAVPIAPGGFVSDYVPFYFKTVKGRMRLGFVKLRAELPARPSAQ